MRDRSGFRVAVGIVLVAVETVVGVVAEALVYNAGERTDPAEAVADVIVAVGDVAVLPVLDRAGDRFGLEPAEAVVGIPGFASTYEGLVLFAVLSCEIDHLHRSPR